MGGGLDEERLLPGPAFRLPEISHEWPWDNRHLPGLMTWKK